MFVSNRGLGLWKYPGSFIRVELHILLDIDIDINADEDVNVVDLSNPTWPPCLLPSINFTLPPSFNQ